jgi:hypothetical protein
MLSNSFLQLVDSMIDKNQITPCNVKTLAREVFADGIAARDQADILVALDRAVSAKCSEWDDFLVGAVVDFAVWASRPTGRIDRDAAHWLTTTLSAGEGPTDNAMRIAFEVVREAESCDEQLVSFAMRRTGERQRRPFGELVALVS